MPTITWKDKVRVRVGELTRAGQFDLWRAAEQSGLIDDGETEIVVKWSALGDNLVAVHATRSIDVCDGDEWRRLSVGESCTLQLDEGDEIKLHFPMTEAAFDALPKSLANPWIETAIDENGGLHNALFFASSLVKPTNGRSETQPDTVS